MALLIPVYEELGPPTRILPPYPFYPPPHLRLPVLVYGRPCFQIPPPSPLLCRQAFSVVRPTAPVLFQKHSPPPAARIPFQGDGEKRTTKKNHISKAYKLIEVSWKFPEKGYLKLNTDGSFKGNPGKSSFGGLIRDDKGKWICGFLGKMSGSQTSLYAEIAGLARGLALIHWRKLKNIIVETDCKAVIQLMKSAESMDIKNRARRILLACKKIMIECNCTLVHTLREGNYCADQLAQLGGEQSKGLEILENPPARIVPFLLADESGVTYTRKVSA